MMYDIPYQYDMFADITLQPNTIVTVSTVPNQLFNLDNLWLNAVLAQKNTPTAPTEEIETTEETVTQKNSRLNIHRFSQYLANIRATKSSARCARSIRIGLQTAGAKFTNHPVAASDWGNTLEKIGYKKISPEFDAPKKGDIYIIHRTTKHVYGHIAGYSGSAWVSDYKQRNYNVYRDPNVKYSYYRLT